MTPIVKVAVGLAIGVAALFGGLLLLPASQPAAPAAAVSTVGVRIDEDLAQRGASVFTSKYACSGCHAVSSLRVSGSTAGPDLSRVILGEAQAGLRPEAHPIAKWYADKGLTVPDANMDKAAELLAEYLEEPPAYSALMQGQVQRFRGVAGGEEQWEKDAEAIAEFLKKAATAAGE